MQWRPHSRLGVDRAIRRKARSTSRVPSVDVGIPWDPPSLVAKRSGPALPADRPEATPSLVRERNYHADTDRIGAGLLLARSSPVQ